MWRPRRRSSARCLPTRRPPRARRGPTLTRAWAAFPGIRRSAWTLRRGTPHGIKVGPISASGSISSSARRRSRCSRALFTRIRTASRPPTGSATRIGPASAARPTSPAIVLPSPTPSPADTASSMARKTTASRAAGSFGATRPFTGGTTRSRRAAIIWMAALPRGAAIREGKSFGSSTTSGNATTCTTSLRWAPRTPLPFRTSSGEPRSATSGCTSRIHGGSPPASQSMPACGGTARTRSTCSARQLSGSETSGSLAWAWSGIRGGTARPRSTLSPGASRMACRRRWRSTYSATSRRRGRSTSTRSASSRTRAASSPLRPATLDADPSRTPWMPVWGRGIRTS